MYKEILNLEEIIAEKEAEISKITSELNNIKKLAEQFPDLEKYNNPYWSLTFMSSKVNSIATDVQFCTSEKSTDGYRWIYAMPFVKTKQPGLYGRVFTKPAVLLIGKSFSYNWPSEQASYWKDHCIKYGFSKVAIEKIEEYLARDKSHNY